MNNIISSAEGNSKTPYDEAKEKMRNDDDNGRVPRTKSTKSHKFKKGGKAA